VQFVTEAVSEKKRIREAEEGARPHVYQTLRHYKGRSRITEQEGWWGVKWWW